MPYPIKVVIWDWNGTLLNDVDCCLLAMNKMLIKRNMKTIDRKRYQDIFDFPVVDYYLKLGFDFSTDPFEVLSKEFIANYAKALQQEALFDDVHHVLETLRKQGMKQILLSAMEEGMLLDMLSRYNLLHYFDTVIGLDTIHANGKLELAQKHLVNGSFRAQESMLIGDTLHDVEVAESLGCQCVIVPQGHHSIERFCNTRALICQDLLAILNLVAINGNQADSVNSTKYNHYE
jgi:phosphoglycolate phosphatase